jgi:hypothetical protein
MGQLFFSKVGKHQWHHTLKWKRLYRLLKMKRLERKIYGSS